MIGTRLNFEHFVESWIKGQPKSRATRDDRRFVEKAITMIAFKLGDPCCTDPDAVVEFQTRHDNNLTNTLRGLLTFESLKGKRKSLLRTKNKLQAFLDGCC